MSDDSLDGDLNSATSSPEKRRSTAPDILPHQSSFEKRYSHMIHKQILETGVNKEALQRQINAYFSCGGASSSGGGARHRQSSTQEDVNENVTEAAAKREGQVAQDRVKRTGEESRRTLDKAETVDIADLQGAKVSGDL